jgi:demethylmenaquinone methyltransferase / 2-methoxy-6-polyprenyl-1,4-benzoquinol methylase
MFGSIAPRYDFLNHFLSANIDRRWRKTCLEEARRLCSVARPHTLDVGCGTGDLSREFSRIGPVTGCDFCHPMIMIGRRKLAATPSDHTIDLIGADALLLPFRDASFDVVVSAFVLRNLADLEAGLREMRRVLRSGGVFASLEFAIPRVRVVGALYRFYFVRVLPVLGRLISGDGGAYTYLPESVQAFPAPDVLKIVIARAGFSGVRAKRLSAGISCLYTAV